MSNKNIIIELEPLKEDFLSKKRVVKSKFWSRVVTFLMVFGPGLIVTQADNDAGAVSTYTQAGAQYGTSLLWVLLLLLPVTYFCQEMVVRLGIATGKGHAAMIYQRFGIWWGAFSLFDLQLVNFLTIVTEFAAISLALSQLGINPYISVPTAAVSLIILVISGQYLRWERITIVLCLLDLVWLSLAWTCHPSGSELVSNAILPKMPAGGITSSLIFIIIAMVGTTIAPWQLFFQQSCVADKKLRFKDMNYARVDTFIGSVLIVTVAACMMIVGNVMYQKGIAYQDPSQMATALAPHFGSWFKIAILLMMCNAAVLGTMAISLSSAWAYGEVKGWDHSLRLKFKQAPKFYSFYIGAILLAAAVVLIPKAPLQLIIISVQVLAGLMLPSAIIFLQLLLNDKELLGDKYVNKNWNNYINWTVIIVLFILSFILAGQIMLPELFK